MDVFGLGPIHATIVIVVIGVLLQIGLGSAQSTNPLNKRMWACCIVILKCSFFIFILHEIILIIIFE